MEQAQQLDVDEFIKALDGTNAVAKYLGIKPPSVSGWREKGVIPEGKLIRLAPYAESRGVKSRRELFPQDWAQIWPELAEAAMGGGAIGHMAMK
jgi:hypothetical protein